MIRGLLGGTGFGRTVGDNQQQQSEIQQRQLQIEQLRQQQMELRQLQAEKDGMTGSESVAASPTATDYKAIHAKAAAKMVADGKCGDAVSYLKAVDEPDMMQSTIAICASAHPPS